MKLRDRRVLTWAAQELHDRYCEFAGGGMCYALECALLDELTGVEVAVLEDVAANMPPAILAIDGGPTVAYAMRITAWIDELKKKLIGRVQ
jgi:hypothetical protein